MPYAQLALAVLLWASSFAAAKWMILSFPPLWGCGIRFLVAFALGLLFCSRRELWNRENWRLSCAPGLVLGLAIAVQTMGLELTSVAHSAFLTTLYVVLVPVFAALFFREPISLRHWGLVTLALIGTAILTGMQWDNISLGDGLNIACGALSAIHIIQIGRVSVRTPSALAFNTAQAAWAAIIALAAAIPSASFPTQWEWKSLVALLFLSGPVHLGGFTLQVLVQRKISATTVSLVYLLESPLASLMGFIFLRERMSPTQLFGAAIILCASVLAVCRPTLRR